MSISLTEETSPILRKRCFIPICGQRLHGECSAVPCVPPYERPNDPDILAKMTAEQTEIVQKKAAKSVEEFRPDFRFWLGIGLGLAGVYFLTKRTKKSG